ncbi:hypothetical protein A3F08_00035 [Candidatus Berkelbacteria bacterium RIFCSPHIGHO2_12_FULL_36_9]|uniref:DUF5683 domain-containing protein n=1 Tax=Candidatus Berkelbacteria bacterium RIFCSPHIGHO2_12_FULL_36_9 TaxID=1797469 RepID=A0A1F5EER9_9BACT|nr:MAG: hypothetical protein A3F08_00035 [Candidatus Berkelbacteria bacterium RIFCSPHIGHO2_12_FULL_36_9]
MKRNPWIAAALNFFFMGPGYIYNGKRVWLGLGWTVGAVLLTYVEFQVKVQAPDMYLLMFGSVFLINLCFAVDGYKEAKELQ